MSLIVFRRPTGYVDGSCYIGQSSGQQLREELLASWDALITVDETAFVLHMLRGEELELTVEISSEQCSSPGPSLNDYWHRSESHIWRPKRRMVVFRDLIGDEFSEDYALPSSEVVVRAFVELRQPTASLGWLDRWVVQIFPRQHDEDPEVNI